MSGEDIIRMARRGLGKKKRMKLWQSKFGHTPRPCAFRLSPTLITISIHSPISDLTRNTVLNGTRSQSTSIELQKIAEIDGETSLSIEEHDPVDHGPSRKKLYYTELWQRFVELKGLISLRCSIKILQVMRRRIVHLNCFGV